MIPNLVATLHYLHVQASAVCLLRVENVLGSFSGTVFRIGPDLVLTNEHVLFPKKTRATSVSVDFGCDVDSTGASLPVVLRVGDTATIVGDRADDWAVIRVAGMDAAVPIIGLAGAPVPKDGERAFIANQPGKRILQIPAAKYSPCAVRFWDSSIPKPKIGLCSFAVQLSFRYLRRG